MQTDNWIRAAFLATLLAAGCGTDSERKIVRDAHPDTPPLAPASETGLSSKQVDPGAAGSPAEKQP